MDSDKQAKVFKALGDPTRLRIIEMLLKGELCVCEIIPATGKSQPNVSLHLRILANAGLLTSRREGSSVYYRVSDKKVEDILSISKKIVKKER